jgi:hypothetical protein
VRGEAPAPPASLPPLLATAIALLPLSAAPAAASAALLLS